MRYIKYRSVHYNFNKEFSHFSYWGNIDNKYLFSGDCFTSPSSSSGTNRKCEEQFTGRFDSNQNEIYVGDIVVADGLKAVVIFSDRWCEFKLVGANSVGWYDTITVVGNIHES